MKPSRRRILPCLLLFFALFPRCAVSDPPAARRPVPPPSPSLAEALAALPDSSVADGSVVLTVQPDYVLPPSLTADGAAPPSVAAETPDTLVQTPDTLAERYGRSLQVFSHVLALAPPTMTMLATNPGIADLPLSTLAAQHPTPFLLGTLTPAQLEQMGTVGLGFSDLSPDQQALLKAALPAPFQIVPKSLSQPSYSQGDMEKTGAERAEIDARVAEETRIYKLNTQTLSPEKLFSSLRLWGFLAPGFTFDDAGIGEDYSENGFETTGAYKLANGGRGGMDFTNDSPLQPVLRSEQPNVPKAGDLEWNRRDLERTISMASLRSVDDLVARLAKATGLELYAGAYAAQRIQTRGDLKTAQPAGDVMQALALCVCGTWRQVGPAYVLTDDVAGLGTRQVFLKEMVQSWSNRLTEAGKAVGGHLGELDWLHTLRFAPGDTGTLSLEQIDAIHKEYGGNGGHLHWKDLPLPLQAGLRGQLTRHFDGDNMTNFEDTAKGVARTLKPDSSVGVSLNLRLAVALPDTGAMTLGDPYRVQMPPAPSAPSMPAPAGDAALVNSIVLDKPLRGLLCAPKTPDEARAVVALLPKMGLNTLFLDVFTSGRAYFPNHALPPETAQAGGVLQAALDAAKVSHIPVYAVIDLLCWRKDGAAVHPQPWPAHFAEDLTVTGEAPDRSVQRQIAAGTVRSDFDREYEMVQHGSQGWVSPLDPRVFALLPFLVHDLAETKGIAGLVLQDTAALGYLGLENDFDEENIALGYTTENRLAYLRTSHSDPVDLSDTDNISLFLPFEGFQASFDVSLPALRMFGSVTPGTWNKVRSDADTALLASCFSAARSAAPALPLLMRERRMGMTFEPWTDPRKLNQVASLNTMDHPFSQITSASILSIPDGPVERAHPDRLRWQMPGSGMVGSDGSRAGGEVFDLVTGGPPEHLADTLDKLSVLLKRPEEKSPSTR